MEIKEMEARLKELKVRQGDIFKKKKTKTVEENGRSVRKRDEATMAELSTIREEMNQLKEQVRKNYADRKAAKSS